MPRMTARQAKAYDDLTRTLTRVKRDMAYPVLTRGHLPRDWAGITATPVPDKVRITLRVDADVARFYRALGEGYQRVMNDVLRSFMLARLSEVLPEPSEVDLAEVDAPLQELLEQEARLMGLLEGARAERLGQKFT